MAKIRSTKVQSKVLIKRYGTYDNKALEDVFLLMAQTVEDSLPQAGKSLMHHRTTYLIWLAIILGFIIWNSDR